MYGQQQTSRYKQRDELTASGEGLKIAVVQGDKHAYSSDNSIVEADITLGGGQLSKTVSNGSSSPLKMWPQ